MTTTSTPTTHNPGENKGPIDRFHLGTVHVTIWENTDPKGQVYHTVRVERRYQDDKGDWHPTSTFRPNEVPVAMSLLEQAHWRLQELKKLNAADSRGRVAA